MQEWTKIKRTGFLPALLSGALLGAAIPAVNMAVRSGLYTGLPGSPLQILLEANWQLTAMINLLLLSVGACILYHIEYEENAMQKMRSLPVRESCLFFGKLLILLLMTALILAIEAFFYSFCAVFWFPEYEALPCELLTAFGRFYLSMLPAVSAALTIASVFQNMWISLGTHVLCIFTATMLELLTAFGRFYLSMLPAVSAALTIASVFQNMWISLGTHVLCIFTATMLPGNSSVLALFPFSLPFQLPSRQPWSFSSFLIVTVVECTFFFLAELSYLKYRRSFV